MVTLIPYAPDAVLIREWIEGEEIVLDNVPIRVEGGVGYQLANAFGRKQQQGEPGPDDHMFNSTHTQRTWVSGQLVRDLQEDADVGKYWRGHAWTQTRGAMGHALKVVKIPLPDSAPIGPCYPLDKINDVFFYAIGWDEARIYAFVPETGTLTEPGDTIRQVQGLVTNVGVSFRVAGATPNLSDTQMYIPTTSGYTRMGEDFDTIDVVDWATVAFALNEDKIYRLSATGQVWFATRHDDDWQFVGILNDGSEARNMWQDYDDDANRVIAVSSSSGMWMLDHDNGILWPTDLTFPEHAYQGYGGAAWRGDTYVSVGVGVHRKVGSLITAAGLDNGDGLPAPYAGGLIVDLEPSYNLLVAALASEPPPEIPTYTTPAVAHIHHEESGIGQGLPLPLVTAGTHFHYDPVIGIDARIGAIYVWNGTGWSEVSTWNRAPTRVVVTMVRNPTQTDRHQHLFWGDVDGGAYYVRIPSTYYNPIESPNLPLDRLSDLEESRIDWNMPDTPKLAKQLNIKPVHLWHKLSPDQIEPAFLNRIQVICHWIDLDGLEHTSEDPDVLSGPGPYPFSDGVAPLPYLELRAEVETDNSRRAAPIGWERYKNTGVLLPTGLPHEAIWLSYRFIGDERSDYTGGVIQWRTIVARKWTRPHRIYTFRIDAQTAIKGMSESDVLKFIDDITLKVGGVPMVTGDEFRIVDVTRIDGFNDPGLSPRGGRTISCMSFVDESYEDLIAGPL
jgi:hypothetical protein